MQESGATLELSADGKPVNGDASGGAAFDASLQAQGGQLTYVPGTVRVAKGVATLTGNRIAYGDTPARHGGPDQKGALNDVDFLHLLVEAGTTVNATTLDGMTGSIDVAGRLAVAGAVGGRPNLALLGGTLAAGGGYRLAEGESFAGFGTIAGNVRGAASSRFAAQDGDLALGDRTSFSGFITDGEIDTGVNAVQLLARGFATLGQVTTIGGGRLSAPGGVVLLGGRAIEGFGAVAARIAANAGSTIDATGTLDLGTANATDGFFSEGQLNVGRHVVTLRDRNEAVLGSTTMIAGGTLKSVNGIPLRYGTRTGSFAHLAGLGLAPGLRWSLDYDAHSLFADAQAVPEPQTWALFGVGIASLALLRRWR